MSDPTNTHIDKEARTAIRMLLDHVFGTSTLTEYGKVYIREILHPPTSLPAEGESSPKPEAGERGVCHNQMPSGRPACMALPIDGCPCSETKTSQPKPEPKCECIAEFGVAVDGCDCSKPTPQPATGVQHEDSRPVRSDNASEQGGSTNVGKGASPQGAVPQANGVGSVQPGPLHRADRDIVTQPAEPKVMPPEEYGKGSIDWSKAAIVPPVSPQPSEQAKGAEPSDMAKRLTNKLWLNHLGMDVIRNYALEIDAAFAAEMESVKKGASR